MATIGNTMLTLVDHAKRRDPSGRIALIVEMLSQENELLKDIVWREGNLPTGERVTYRNAIPSPTYRRMGEGTTSGKSTTQQFDEACAIMESRSKIDVDTLTLNGDSAEFRASEEVSFLEGINNEIENGMFYNNTSTAPEKYLGLAPRFASTTQDMGGSQIVLCNSGAAGADQTSAWLVGWGDRSVYGIFPKGSKAGVEVDDLGKQLTLDSGGTKEMLAYVTNWKVKLGLVVKDYRYVARVANIDTSVLAATGHTDDTIIPAMIRASHKVKRSNGVRWTWYVNSTTATYLDLQARAKTAGNAISFAQGVQGEEIMKFRGVPVKVTDGILNNEAAIS